MEITHLILLHALLATEIYMLCLKLTIVMNLNFNGNRNHGPESQWARGRHSEILKFSKMQIVMQF